MKIHYGLTSGAVLQRMDDTCHIDFYAEVVGTPRVSPGNLRIVSVEDGITRLRLTDIPIGGPYTLVLSDDADKITFHEIYVGDVWMLAGQSNMAGIGYFSGVACDYTPLPFLRSFLREDMTWVPAHPIAHHPYNRPRGVGPGYYFAKEMFDRTGVPQGIIACAVGGSSMAQWDPRVDPKEENLYTLAIRRLRLCGGRMRGIFWYQGCAETGPGADAIFVENMKRTVAAFRAEASDSHLPVVQVQINRYTNVLEDSDAAWSRIRELQRTLSLHISDLDTVSTVGYTLDDGIHLDGPSQRKLGVQAADSMYHLCFDPIGCRSRLAPSLESISIADDPNYFGNVIAVRFGNLHGALTSVGVPTGFTLSTRSDRVDRRHIFRIDLHEETVCLLSKLKTKQHIEINLDMEELDLTDAEKKATYQEIKDYVLEQSGLKVSSLYIAQVKQKCGIIERENYNKPKSEDAKQPQCPPDKEKAIREALKHFGMI